MKFFRIKPTINPGAASFQSGQAMITAVIFFLFISVTIVLGIASPILKQVQNGNNLIRSKESYFLAGGALEDAIFRVKTSKNLAANETFIVNGYTTTITLTTSGSEKIIDTISDRGGLIRKMQARVTPGIGITFNYGLQTGNGGFELTNNAGVNGNVYANGDIIGSNNTFITGTAIAGNTVSLVTDQVNDSPTPSANCSLGDCVNFRNTSNVSSQDLAQSFQISIAAPINKVQLYLKKTGSPANATVRIATDNAGSPSSTYLDTGTLNAGSVTGTYNWIDVVFSTNVELDPGVTYWIVIDNGTQSTSAYYTIGANSSYASGRAKIGQFTGSWANTTQNDVYFRIYTGGFTSTISGVSTIGGDAWARTVTNTSVTGNLYCQTGSGNNKSCNTSRPDPAPQPYPISEANIQQWKDEATDGGTTSGNYTWSSGTLGPRKITGNLTISNTVTMGGTIWVQGNITVTNNATIRLASGYGATSGAIVADGRVSIDNNVQFLGSGQSGSYILLLTTSDCPVSSSCGGVNALTIGNNVGATMLNAQNGTAYLSNNAAAKEITGYKVKLENNAVVTYETGLANVNFSSGPGGTFDILSWKEVE